MQSNTHHHLGFTKDGAYLTDPRIGTMYFVKDLKQYATREVAREALPQFCVEHEIPKGRVEIRQCKDTHL